MSTLDSSQFTLLSQIGTGSFGTVFQALHRPTNKQCAIKRIDLENSDDDIEEIQKEIAILSGCNDHHITQYFGCFMHEFELWIVMEFLGGGSCLDLMKDLRPATLPESAIAEIIAQVVEGLAYLHDGGKIHRDIKAANVLISNSGEVKIADFGVAAQLSNNLSRRNTFVGTPFWMAPEVIDQRDYSFSADIWSLGVTAMELAHGKPPLSHLHPMKALFSIPRSEPPKLDVRFSSEFQEFVQKCLQIDPKKRAKVAELKEHPFLTRRNKQELLHLMHQRLPPSPLQLSLRKSNSSMDSDGSRTIDSTRRADTRTRAVSGDSASTVFSSASEDLDNWDFDTLKPQPSLEQLLQNPPPKAVPPPVPTTPINQSYESVKRDTLHNTLCNNNMEGPRTVGSHNLVRIFSHASTKFKEPVLNEISGLLRADPLTVSVESYVVKRIAKLAGPKKEKGFDAVEQILYDKWVEDSLSARRASEENSGSTRKTVGEIGTLRTSRSTERSDRTGTQKQPGTLGAHKTLTRTESKHSKHN